MPGVCSVCLEQLKSPTSIPCGHVFCADCLTSYANSTPDPHTAPCPDCRQDFPLGLPDMQLLPPKYHAYVNAGMRRLYLDRDELTVETDKRIEQLESSITTLEAENARLRTESTMYQDLLRVQRETDSRKIQQLQQALRDGLASNRRPLPSGSNHPALEGFSPAVPSVASGSQFIGPTSRAQHLNQIPMFNPSRNMRNAPAQDQTRLAQQNGIIPQNMQAQATALQRLRQHQRSLSFQQSGYRRDAPGYDAFTLQGGQSSQNLPSNNPGFGYDFGPFTPGQTSNNGMSAPAMSASGRIYDPPMASTSMMPPNYAALLPIPNAATSSYTISSPMMTSSSQIHPQDHFPHPDNRMKRKYDAADLGSAD